MTVLGWCSTGHHGFEPGVDAVKGLCPGVTPNLHLECSCPGHEGVEMRRATVHTVESLRLDGIVDDETDTVLLSA